MLTGRAFRIALLLALTLLVLPGCGSGGMLRSAGFRGGVPEQSEPPLDDKGAD